MEPNPLGATSSISGTLRPLGTDSPLGTEALHSIATTWGQIPAGVKISSPATGHGLFCDTMRQTKSAAKN